jgi:LPXTG-motif cell wall-anchored protein
MKKSFLILLIIIFVIISASSVFAASEVKEIDDSLVPAAPAENTDAEVYESRTTEIRDSEIPAGEKDTSVTTVTIEDTIIPEASSLPKTGGIPAEAFYIGGGLFVAAAAILAKKKS